MTPAARLHVVSPDDSVASVLRLMASHDVNQVPVLRGRELAGILARADIIRLIQTREELSREQRLPKQDAPEPAADEELPRGVTPR
jgi:CBS domain-containing protein